MEIRYYKEVLEEDYRVLSQTLLPLTLKKVAQLKQTYMEKYLRHYVKSRLAKYSHSPRGVPFISLNRLKEIL